MSVGEEKIFILRMLEEGKISSDEAARLLEAIGTEEKKSDTTGAKKQKKPSFNDEVSKVKERLNDWKKEFKKSYNQKDFDRAVEEFTNRAEKIGKNLAHTTIGFADKLVDFVGSFVDTSSFNVFGKYKAVNKTFNVDAPKEGLNLDIEAINGHILVKKHMQDCILIRTIVKSAQDDVEEILNFSHDEESVAVKYNKIGNTSISHEVFLPNIKFKNIRLVTKNGKIYVEDSLSENFEAVTGNSNVDLMGVASESINVVTKNGRINFRYIIGRDINVNTNNSVIEIKQVKTANINALTRNGRILVENVHNYRDESDINMNLTTAYAGIKVNMNDMEDKGYRIKGETTNAEINLLIPEITYNNISNQMNKKFVEAQSSGYDGYENKVNITAHTVSGHIEIVK